MGSPPTPAERLLAAITVALDQEEDDAATHALQAIVDSDPCPRHLALEAMVALTAWLPAVVAGIDDDDRPDQANTQRWWAAFALRCAEEDG